MDAVASGGFGFEGTKGCMYVLCVCYVFVFITHCRPVFKTPPLLALVFSLYGRMVLPPTLPHIPGVLTLYGCWCCRPHSHIRPYLSSRHTFSTQTLVADVFSMDDCGGGPSIV